METSAFKSESRSKLVSDLQAVIRDAEELLQNVGDQTDSKFQSAKEQLSSKLENFSSTIDNAKSSLSNAQASFISRTKDAAAATDSYVQENPWRSVGAVAAVGLLIGLLLGRK